MAKCAVHQGRGRAPKDCVACYAGKPVMTLVISSTVGRTDKAVRMTFTPSAPDKHKHGCGHSDRCAGAKCGECQKCARDRSRKVGWYI